MLRRLLLWPSAASALTAIGVYYYLYGSNQILTPDKLNPQYDYIIVGGGSAGCVLASRLSEDPDNSVLLLEAGDDDWSLPHVHVPGFAAFVQQTRFDWHWLAEPQKYSSLGIENNAPVWPRGKVLGGTSILNYMIHGRGSRSDYNRWTTKHGVTGWGYDDMLPYFKKSETASIEGADKRYRGLRGPITARHSSSEMSLMGEALLKAAKANGYDVIDDYNGEKHLGFSKTQYSISDNGIRMSASKAYLRPAMNRPNLHVVTGAHVTKVNFNEENKAIGVDYVHSGKKNRVLPNREIILCAGAVNSPQLLMLSGVGPKEHLEKHHIPVVVDSPHVGQHLKDHLFYPLYLKTKNAKAVLNLDEITSIPSLITTAFQYLFKGTGLLAYPGIEISAFLASGLLPESYESDLQLYYFPSEPTMKGRLRYLTNVTAEVMSDTMANISAGEHLFVIIPSLNQPFSQGSIELRDSNPQSPPVIDPNYLSSDIDVKILIKGIRIVEKLVETMRAHFDIDKVGVPIRQCLDYPYGSDQYYECDIRHRALTIYHPMSTCRMGANTTNSVVDSSLRVHGVKGLRVVDASVFPDAISGNTNMPVIAVAEKAADIIKNSYKA